MPPVSRITLGLVALFALLASPAGGGEPAAKLGVPRPLPPGEVTPATPVPPSHPAREPAVRLGRPVALEAPPAAATDVCPATPVEVDDAFLVRTASLLVSPGHIHAGTADVARELLLDLARSDRAMAGRVATAARAVYSHATRSRASPDLGETLRLFGELTALLPPDHPGRRGVAAVNELRDHALAWLDRAVAGAAVTGKGGRSTPVQEPAGAQQAMVGIATALDSLSADERQAWISSFLGELGKRRLGDVEQRLLAPLARHFGERETQAALQGLAAARGTDGSLGASALAFVATLARVSPNPRVQQLSRDFLTIWRGPQLASLKTALQRRSLEQRDELTTAGRDLRKVNQELRQLAIGLGLDIAAMIDPSPLCSALSGGFCIYRELQKENPDYLAVTLALASVVPVLGKGAVGARWLRDFERLRTLAGRAKTILDGISRARGYLHDAQNAVAFLETAAGGLELVRSDTRVAAKVVLATGLEEAERRFLGLPLPGDASEPQAAELVSRFATRLATAQPNGGGGCNWLQRRLGALRRFLTLPDRWMERLGGARPAGLPAERPRVVRSQMPDESPEALAGGNDELIADFLSGRMRQ